MPKNPHMPINVEAFEYLADKAAEALEFVDKIQPGDTSQDLKAAQRHLVLAARDITRAAGRLYTAITIAESAEELKSL